MTQQQIEGLIATMNTHLKLAGDASVKLANALKEKKGVGKKPLSAAQQKAMNAFANSRARYTPVK